jgi:hypothetical protein
MAIDPSYLITRDKSFNPHFEEQLKTAVEQKDPQKQSDELATLSGHYMCNFPLAERTIANMPESAPNGDKKMTIDVNLVNKKIFSYCLLAENAKEVNDLINARKALTNAERLITLIKPQIQESVATRVEKLKYDLTPSIFTKGMDLGTKVISNLGLFIWGDKYLYHDKIKEELIVPIVNAIVDRLLRENLWEFEGAFREGGAKLWLDSAEKELRNKKLESEKDVITLIDSLEKDGTKLIPLLKRICNSIDDPSILKDSMLPLLLDQVLRSPNCKLKTVETMHLAFPASKGFWPHQ